MKSRCFQRSPLCWVSWKDAFSVTLFTGYVWTVGQTSDKPPFSQKNGQYVWSGRTDVGNGPSTVNSMPCKTYYLTAVLAHVPAAKVPQLAGKLFDSWAILVYPLSGVTPQSHCTPPLLSMLESSFSHCTDHCSIGCESMAEDAWEKKHVQTGPNSTNILE